MVSNRWLAARRPHWERLEALLRRAGTAGLSRMSGTEVRELGLLYRQTASDLSTVLEDASSVQLAAYLNELLGRSHNLLYKHHHSGRRGILTFYIDAFPRIFRESLPAITLATAIFVLTALAGWAVSAHDPGFAHRLLGPRMMDSIEQRHMWTEPVIAIQPVAESTITTNNLSVAFALFALGITGVGTIWLLTLNGLLLGVIGEATWRAGMALSLWSFVAPHGVLELPAICIAGGAGLEVARGLLFPGLLPRRESVAQAGRRAVRLLLGALPLLVIAGAIEAFFSPTHAPVAMKFSLAAVLFGMLIVYLRGLKPTAAR